MCYDMCWICITMCKVTGKKRHTQKKKAKSLWIKPKSTNFAKDLVEVEKSLIIQGKTNHLTTHLLNSWARN